MARAQKPKSPRRISSFSKFWPYYLGEHSIPATRYVHTAGTLTGVVVALTSVITANYGGLAVALLLGYAPAWLAHFFIENNKPATFRYPLWSFLADFKMCFLTLAGRLRPGN